MIRLKRVSEKPILVPRRNIKWEQSAVLNAAAIMEAGITHLFYRGVSHVPEKNRSCIGHAWSSDGINFECADNPILRYGTRNDNSIGCEDPRIVKIDDTYYLTYVTWNGKNIEIALCSSPDLREWKDHGVIFDYSLFGNNKNASLWPEKINGQFALIHRPMGFTEEEASRPLDIWLSFSSDLKNWSGHRRLLRTRRGEIEWEYAKIGLGAPPFRTPKGWLMVYHAVSKDLVYRLGLVLLDINDPANVLKRTDIPILEPQMSWEKTGDVENVVFTCGAVLNGTKLSVYYGGADTVIGLAEADVLEFIDSD